MQSYNTSHIPMFTGERAVKPSHPPMVPPPRHMPHVPSSSPMVAGNQVPPFVPSPEHMQTPDNKMPPIPHHVSGPLHRSPVYCFPPRPAPTQPPLFHSSFTSDSPNMAPNMPNSTPQTLSIMSNPPLVEEVDLNIFPASILDINSLSVNCQPKLLDGTVIPKYLPVGTLSKACRALRTNKHDPTAARQRALHIVKRAVQEMSTTDVGDFESSNTKVRPLHSQ